MQGDIVTAARWLGASIVLASVVVAGGLRWSRAAASGKPIPTVTASSVDPKMDSVIQRFAEHEYRFPILDPIPGEIAPASCLDPPSEEEVWEKVPVFKTGSPVFYETQRDNVRILIEKIGEKVDSCKIYPLAGPCELIHCHYRCTVEFDEQSRSVDPIPINHRKARVEVVYLDKDHLRRCSNPPPAVTVPSASSDGWPGTETSRDRQSDDRR